MLASWVQLQQISPVSRCRPQRVESSDADVIASAARLERGGAEVNIPAKVKEGHQGHRDMPAKLGYIDLISEVSKTIAIK